MKRNPAPVFHRERKQNVMLSVPVSPAIKRAYLRLCKRYRYCNSGVIVSALIVRYLLTKTPYPKQYDTLAHIYLPGDNHVGRRTRRAEWAADAARCSACRKKTKRRRRPKEADDACG